MIRILFFIEKFGGGGAEKVLRDLVNHMDQSRFDITVQSVWPYDEGKLLAPGIKYKTVYSARNRINEMRYRMEAAAKLTYPLHIKDDYDIECAFLETGPTKIISASTNRKAKKIAWVHCDLLKALPDVDAFTKKTASWYAAFDKVVCVSNSVKESFDRVFSGRFPSTVLYNMIDSEAIRKLAEEPCPAESDRLVVVAVGSIYPPKNYPRLLSAHRRILGDGLKHELWILGDGQDRKKLENIISVQGLSESVRLFGFQNNPYPFVKRADVLACSSNYEGFSTVITEGTILGKAIVTTDCSGMREILGDSECGLITDNDDESFYNGLKLMLQSEQRRTAYAEKAQQRGKAFSPEQRASEAEHFFIQLLKK